MILTAILNMHFEIYLPTVSHAITLTCPAIKLDNEIFGNFLGQEKKLNRFTKNSN